MDLLWITLLLATLFRLVLAAMGHLSGPEAYLVLCAHHLDWGFIEGPAGIAALIKSGAAFFGWTPFGVRFLSPLFLLIASWSLMRLAVTRYSKETMRWTVIIFNLLPLANLAAVIMDGTMVIATIWILAITSAWYLLRDEKCSWKCCFF